ncbi:MAG: adenylyltransferase/cytidyltransferase family protein [Pseudodesulfovibrio sp.]|nr:adenylyltransferase/cytidyltransferase family protein [Pseudodesulfovibrio sp.]
MKHPVGIIHGRFQVLHLDHLKYLLAGKALCEHLVVGITNPDPTATTPEDSAPDRSHRKNNPLTYYERCRMVRAALMEADVPPQDFSIVPFPICHPLLLRNYAPEDAVYYLTIYDEWGHEKMKRLKSLDLQTYVIWEKPLSQKGLNGSNVRQAISQNNDWETMVPASVADMIMKWDIQKRLENFS